MKNTLLGAIILVFAACNSKSKVDPKEAKYDTSSQITAFYLTDTKIIKFQLGPTKRVVRHYSTMDGIDSVTHPGEFMIKTRQVVDTIYIFPTIDSTLIVKDSLGKNILDSNGKIQYNGSFRKPETRAKEVVQETEIVRFPTLK